MNKKTTAETVTSVKISEVKIPAEKARSIESAKKDLEKWNSFKESIKLHGVIQPVQIYQTSKDGISKLDKENPEGTFYILNGLRRLYASTELKLDTIPARVFSNLSDTDIREKMVVSNIHSFAMTRKELKQNILDLVALGKSFSEIAKQLSISEKTVIDWLQIASLPEDVQKSIFDNKLSIANAIEIVKAKKSGLYKEDEMNDLILSAIDMKAGEFKAKMDIESLERREPRAKKTEYVHMPDYSKERVEELFAKMQNLKKDAELDGRMLTIEEIVQYDTIMWIYQSSPEDVETKRKAWNEKHKK